ncbi:outer membrane protein assembly factor BamB family protein [Methanolobus psychrotolerans]|uniref:outer membrane protein assembly factor BamB family protein n=1 Tax=Methanolobus psychrotolerans TaxID=1874706 RepID=UPI000B91924D|nr:PQQ-binding-like beta-propeller repeat protein [Methanolobus psychrotolerans]
MKEKWIIPILFLSLFMIISPAVAEENTDGTWHQFHRDAANTGNTSSTAPDNNNILWSSPAISAIASSSPVIAEDMVFVNCVDGEVSSLKALDIDTGNVLWSEEVDAQQWGSWASPVYDDGKVFVSMGTNITCFDASTHAVLWDKMPSSQASCDGSPTVADGKVFVNDWQGAHYYSYDETTGALLGSFEVFKSGPQGPRAQGTPAYYDGKLYLTSVSYQYYNESDVLREGYLYCVDADDLSHEYWRCDFENGLWGSAAVADGIVYVATYDFYDGEGGDIYALNAETGAIIWGKDDAIKVTDGTISTAYGNVYVAGGYQAGQVYCFDGATGDLVWETEAGLKIGAWTNSVAVADGKVFAGREVASGTGMRFGFEYLFAMDAYTGELLWKGSEGGASPAVADGKVFTIDDDGKVYCYGGGTDTVDLNVAAVSATPYYNHENTITATVANDGSSYAGDVTISLLIDGSLTDSTTVSVAGGHYESVEFPWTPTEEKDYDITITAGFTGTDIDLSNNQKTQVITVIDADADLVPQAYNMYCYKGQEYGVPVVIENQGYKTSNPCSVNVATINIPEQVIEIPAIEPGENYTIYFKEYTISDVIHHVYVTVDIDDDTPEVTGVSGGESNNVADIWMRGKELTLPDPEIGDWQQFHQNSVNVGAKANYGPSDDEPVLIWDVSSFTGGVDVVPIIAGNRTYALSSGGILGCYEKYNGTYIWSVEVETSTLQTSTPAYGYAYYPDDRGTVAEEIYVATNGGDLYAFNANTGEQVWKREVTDEGFETPVTYHDHRIYVADGLGPSEGTKYMYCFDDMGNEIWRHAHNDSAGFIWAGAAVVGDYVIYPVQEGILVSLYTANGTVADEMDLSIDPEFAVAAPGRLRSSLVYQDGYVYCTSDKGNDEGYLWKVSYDNSTGTFTDNGWSSMIGFSTSTPVVYDGKVYVGTGEHGDEGAFVCVNDADGQIEWSFVTDGGVKSSPVLSTFDADDPLLYFTTQTVNGSLYCINTTGSLIWEYNPSGDDQYVLQGVALSDGNVYYGTDAGYLYCIGGDWNDWNDMNSPGGQVITLAEIRNAIVYWKFSAPGPGTGHVVSLSEIRNMIVYWKFSAPM